MARDNSARAAINTSAPGPAKASDLRGEETDTNGPGQQPFCTEWELCDPMAERIA